MPTNEAGLSGGKDLGDGGKTPASDMPGGEQNMGVGQDVQSPSQVATDEDAEANGDPGTATGPGD